MRPHVHLGRGLKIGMTKLEHDFRVADGKSIFVGDAATQYERIVVEAEIPGIEKHYFPDARARFLELPGGKADLQLFRGAAHDFAKIVKGRQRGEAIRLQNQLGFEIMDRVERMSITIRVRTNARD